MCTIVRQVFNGVSDETQRMFRCFCVCVCVCACLYVRVSLLMCTLHSVAMVTTFFIRAIVVGLPPGAASHSLTSVKICQFDFFRVCCDLRILRTSRQQTLKLLREIGSLEALGATFIQTCLLGNSRSVFQHRSSCSQGTGHQTWCKGLPSQMGFYTGAFPPPSPFERNLPCK